MTFSIAVKAEMRKWLWKTNPMLWPRNFVSASSPSRPVS